MNKRTPIISAVVAAALLTAGPLHAAKKEKPAKGERRASARLLAHFDANHDGSLDATEAVRVRRAFAGLKTLDANKDGDLSDSEIGAAKVPKKKGKGKKRRE